MAKDGSEIKKGAIGRRDSLKVISTGPAALVPIAVDADQKVRHYPHIGATPPKQAAAYRRQSLDEHEWKTIGVLSDLIIPADERSRSATQAGVPGFIDDWLAFEGGNLLAEIRGGLTWLDIECQRLFNHDFVDCLVAQQKQILNRIAYPDKAAPEDANAVAFFNHLRDLVVGGFFSSEIGVKDLPYLGNTMVADWQGCPTNVLEKIRENEEKAKG